MISIIYSNIHISASSFMDIFQPLIYLLFLSWNCTSMSLFWNSGSWVLTRFRTSVRGPSSACKWHAIRSWVTQRWRTTQVQHLTFAVTFCFFQLIYFHHLLAFIESSIDSMRNWQLLFIAFLNHIDSHRIDTPEL